jgi:hypothetical protein
VVQDVQFWPDVSAEIEETGVWFYSEEGSNIGYMCEIVRAFLSHFKRDDVWTVSWADWCSKLRLDEFGGGAAVVTADSVEMMTTGQWIYEESERRKKKG